MDLEHEERLSKVEIRSEDNMRRLDEVERRQDNLDELVSTVKVLAVREEKVESDVKEIKTDVKNIANKSAKRWDNLVSQVITLIVAALVGFLLAKFGL